MSCSHALPRLLEASPDDIARALHPERGDGIAESLAGLATHLAACGDCRDAARRILARRSALADALQEVTPRTPLESAVRAALAESKRRRTRGRLRAGAVAAAAMAAGILAVRFSGVGSGDGAGGVRVAEALLGHGAPVPMVETLLDESVAVFAIDDPDVLVVWFYQGRAE